jgi:ketosteroid isomerase-like protein
MASLDERIDSWIRAEQEGDAEGLESLLHPRFLAVGPYGFILNREQWKGRFAGGLKYHSFAFQPDAQTRTLERTAIVVGTQTQQGEHQGRPVDGAFRVTIVFAEDPDWKIIAIHISLRNLPNAGAA